MGRSRAIPLFSVLVIGGLLGACEGFPTSGPAAGDIRGHNVRAETDIDYTLIPISDRVISILLATESTGLVGIFKDRTGPAQIRFGIGDVVGVRIFEASAGGLFIPLEAGARAGNFVDLPDQPVDFNGNIQVPYAGAVNAVAQTPQQVQNTIVERLKNRAIDPQAVVTLREQRATQISVLGDVNTPNRLPTSASGERMLDAISRAGGPKFPGHETFVTLERGGRKATISFLRLVSEPANNIYVRPGDTIYVYRESPTFVAFGATGQTPLGGLNLQIPFDRERLTLAEAVGKAGGLIDDRAEPASIFLYRLESHKVANAIGADVTKETEGGLVPVIYSVNFRDPSGYFHAQRFQMRNHDVLYIANANSVEMTKFLTFLRTSIATVREGDAMVQELRRPCVIAANCR
jgi:polysaccharide export outer membrane protein